MRNLKKVLSLALALVMLLGMMVVGAGAATDYSDADQISNLQAAEVADALGIIEGNAGQFMPTTELDRAQAAQIITRMLLGPDVAKTLTATNSQFTDLTQDWYKAAVTYCAQNGIVEGDGAGKFYPSNKVTGFQFAKMLLVSLGYDAKVEGYNGSGWRTNVAIDALQAGLTQNVQVSDAVLTRDAAVQMVLNCLTADMVYYTLKTDTFGQLAKLTNYKTNYRTTTADNAGNTGVGGGGNVTGGTSTPTNKGDTTMQFCELYFPNLKLVEGDVNGFGDIVAEWKIVQGNTTETISTTDVAYAQQYTAYVTKAKIYSDLGMTAAHTCPYFVDGVESTIEISNNPLYKVGGNGAITTVWINENGDPLRITVKNIYVGDVVAVNSTNSTVTVAPRGTAADGYISGTASATGFAVGDVVLYNNRRGAVVNVTRPETATGTLTAYNERVPGGNYFIVNGNATVDSTSREYSDKVATRANEASLKRGVRVILDTYGNVIDVEGYEAPAEYAYVIGVHQDNYESSRWIAKLVLPTGEVKEVYTNESSAAKKETLVSYTVDRVTGIYTLGNDAATPANQPINTVLTTKGNPNVSITVGSATQGDGRTVFIVKMGPDSYSVYLGIANVPSIKTTVATVKAASISTAGLAKAVYIDASTANSVQFSGTATDHVFVLSSGTLIPAGTDAAGRQYYIYPAIVNGEYKQGFLATNQVYGPTLFSYAAYDAAGIATLSNIVPNGTGTQRLANNAIGLGGTAYSWDSNTKVYKIASNGGSAQVWSVAGIQDDPDDKTWCVGVGMASLIIFQDVVDGSGDNNQQTNGGKLFLDATLSSADIYTDKDTSTKLTVTTDAVSGSFVTIPEGATKVYVKKGSAGQTYQYTGKESTPNLTVSAGGTVEIAITNLNTTTGGWTLNDTQFARVYSVTYALGTGAASGATAPEAQVADGVSAVTTAAAPTAAAGKQFVGWVATSDSKLYKAADSTNFIPTSDETLTAVWMDTVPTATDDKATGGLADAGFEVAVSADITAKMTTIVANSTALSLSSVVVTAGSYASGKVPLNSADTTDLSGASSSDTIVFTVTVSYEGGGSENFTVTYTYA